MHQSTKTVSQTAQSVDSRVQALLQQMTLPEKIGQMTQVEKNSITPEEVTTHFIGSVLSGGGGNPEENNVHEWRRMVEAYLDAALETRLAIPLVYGVDAVHGHGNVRDAVVFPHNIGLGATRDADLVERIGRVTAAEVLATNIHWNFAPAVSVPQDIRWGRTYEGYSENTDLVAELGAAHTRGLQHRRENGEWVLASVKHYVADGGTAWDSRTDLPGGDGANWQAASENWRIDQGDAQIDEDTLRRVHLLPYKHAIDAGAQNIMVSFSSWNGLKMHAHEYLLTDVLKGELGFEGFLVSDWMAVNQLSADFYEAVVTSINAGLDMVMVPYDYKQFITVLTDAVQKGDVSEARIDDAVSRILSAKVRLGLFERPTTDPETVELFGSEGHRELAREAVQKSLVLLKNENEALPLTDDVSIVVAGVAADDIGLACGGWTIEWQGGKGAITRGETLLQGLQAHLADRVTYAAGGDIENRAAVGVVVVAEPPYAEGEGDRDDLTLATDDVELIKAVRSKVDKLVLVIYSGRPVVITSVIDRCDAVVAAWLPGSEADAVADVLTGAVPFTGKLPFTWIAGMEQLPLSKLSASDDDPLFPYGFGLTL